MSIPGSVAHGMQKPASVDLEAVKEKARAMIERREGR